MEQELNKTEKPAAAPGEKTGQETTESTQQQGQKKKDKPPGDVSLMGFLWPMIILFAIFYFLLIRPQKKQDRKKRQMLDSLQKDDKIITVGGVFGTVADITADEVLLRIDEKANVKIKVSRSAVANIIKRKGGDELQEKK